MPDTSIPKCRLCPRHEYRVGLPDSDGLCTYCAADESLKELDRVAGIDMDRGEPTADEVVDSYFRRRGEAA